MINNDVFAKTKKKLIINIMVVVEIFIIAMSVFIYNYFRISVYTTIDRSLLEEYHFIKNQFNKENITEPILLQDPKDIVYVYEGDKIVYYTRNMYFTTPIPATKDDKGMHKRYNGYNFRNMVIKDKKYEYRIIRNIDSEEESISHLLVLLLWLDVFTLLLSYIIAKYLSKKALKPIEASWNGQVKFVQDASHELRTPVSIIQSKLEGLLKTPDATVLDEAESIAVAMRETRQLKKMISELLSLTKEQSIVTVNNVEFDIESLFKEIFESYHEIAEYQNKEFSYSVGMKNKIVCTDPNKLTHLIRILVDNAFKYTSSGDSIEIKAIDKRDKLIVTVRDSGIGISEEDQKHIFERFFRSDSVRATEIEGSGIGLSIATLIASTLGGNIKVKSKLGEGTSFCIEISKKNKKSVDANNNKNKKIL